MNIKRFFGKNSREALSQVRLELGDDAVILSNRAVNGGNEIMAFREDEMNSIMNSEPRVNGITSQRAQESLPGENMKNWESVNRGSLQRESMNRETPDRENANREAMKREPVNRETRSREAMARSNANMPSNSLNMESSHELHNRYDSFNDVPQTRAARPEHSVLGEQIPVRNNQVQHADAPSLLAMLAKKNMAPAPAPAADFKPKVAPVRAAAVPSQQSASKLAHMEQAVQQAKPQQKAASNTPTPPARPVAATAAIADTAKASAVALAQTNKQMSEMLSEMRVMRSAIESQLTAMSWGTIQQREPIKSRILSTLLAAGFSASLSRQLAEKLPGSLNYERGLVWVQSILSRNLKTIENETEVLDMGGIFALIGPTGVGKTTTTAKLAARYVMKHGTQNLGLITTDAYRVGGHEQLRIYGKILGVMVYAVKDEADLKIALNELKHKHTILIDTVGVSQRDRMVAEQVAMLSNSNKAIKKLLCLNATNTGETLTDVIHAYKGKGLDGCIITKIDEAATIGNALDVILREKLKLYYVANGQRVPEDIHMANKQQLIRHAMQLSPPGNKPFQFNNEELPFVMGNTVNAPLADLSEVGYV